MRLTKWLGAAVGLFVVAGVLGVGALALTGTAGAQEPGKHAARFQELLAQKLGISVDKLKEAEKSARDQLIDEALAAGTITSEQAERMKNADLGALGSRLREHFGRGGMVLRAGHNVLETAAEVIGIDVSKVREGLQNGQSLAQIAQANGKSREAFKSALLSELKADIDEAVKDGKINADMATKLKEGLDARIDQMIDRTGGQGLKGDGEGRGFGGRFRGGPR